MKILWIYCNCAGFMMYAILLSLSIWVSMAMVSMHVVNDLIYLDLTYLNLWILHFFHDCLCWVYVNYLVRDNLYMHFICIVNENWKWFGTCMFVVLNLHYKTVFWMRFIVNLNVELSWPCIVHCLLHLTMALNHIQFHGKCEWLCLAMFAIQFRLISC